MFFGGFLRANIHPASAGGADVTPNAVDWLDPVSFALPVTTTNETITGISTAITFRMDVTLNDGLDIYYSKNSGSWTLITAGGTGTNLATVSISNNDTLQFKADNAQFSFVSATVEVYNTSDSNTLIDSFTFQYFQI